MTTTRSYIFAIGLVLLGARAIVGCMNRCQMGDARPECNAYGNPDLSRDAAPD